MIESPALAQAIADYVGMPCILKDAHGGGWKDVYVCHSLEELLHHYDSSGRLTMVVQEFIEWDQFVRCICIGQEHVLPMKYDPRERKYHVEHEHLSRHERVDRLQQQLVGTLRDLGHRRHLQRPSTTHQHAVAATDRLEVVAHHLVPVPKAVEDVRDNSRVQLACQRVVVETHLLLFLSHS